MTPDLLRAKARLSRGDCTVALCRGDREHTDTRRGVAPLLSLLDEGADMSGFAAADRVVGKAAAFLYVRLGVAAVYAPVMSRPAYDLLTAHGIPAYGDALPDAIRNRAGDGYCPMETVVWELDDPVAAEVAIRRKRAELANAQTP